MFFCFLNTLWHKIFKFKQQQSLLISCQCLQRAPRSPRTHWLPCCKRRGLYFPCSERKMSDLFLKVAASCYARRLYVKMPDYDALLDRYRCHTDIPLPLNYHMSLCSHLDPSDLWCLEIVAQSSLPVQYLCQAIAYSHSRSNPRPDLRHQWPTLQVSVPSQTSLIFPPVPHGSHTRSAILPRASPVPIALASRETIASRRRAIPRRHARQRTRPRSHSKFSVASHSRTSSDLPAQSHRFFLRSIGMRQDLVDWMSQQHSTLELVDETLHLAIRYLDTFLNRRGAHRPRPPRANRPTPSSKYPLKPENQCA